MKTVVRLDDKDLQRIVAERFDVPLSKVRMCCKEAAYGYLGDETTEYAPYCEVEKFDDKTQ